MLPRDEGARVIDGHDHHDQAAQSVDGLKPSGSVRVDSLAGCSGTSCSLHQGSRFRHSHAGISATPIV
jgi:hypothetical protein